VNIVKLSWRSIQNNALRSTIIFTMILLIAGMLTFTLLIIYGAHASFRSGIERLGADVLVFPEGTETQVQSALFMGATVEAWMPAENLRLVRDIPGVKQASPQLYLASLANAPCCSTEMFIMAFEPESDFTITPWLAVNLDHPLALDQAIGGSKVFIPYGEETIRIYGTDIDLLANLEPTGTGLDATLFLTFETAYAVAADSYTLAIKPLEIPDNNVSAILVQVEPGTDPRITALQIMNQIPAITAIPAQSLFLTYRQQAERLQGISLMFLGVSAVLTLILLSLVFSMGISQRQREIGILRALGANRRAIWGYLYLEAALLALGGGMTGIVLTSYGVYLFHNLIVASLGVAFLFPLFPLLLGMAGFGLVLISVGIGLAILVPVARISRLDPGIAMQG
jgi:putative ABC transport system permease protein